MQLNLQAFLPTPLRNKRIFVRIFLVIFLIALCFIISLPILYLSMNASAETPTVNSSATTSDFPLQTPYAHSPGSSATSTPLSSSTPIQPAPSIEQETAPENAATVSNPTTYPAWYSYLITTSSIMNTIIASVYAYGISASVKTQRGILYAELLPPKITYPGSLFSLRIGSFIFAIMLVVCAKLRSEFAMFLFWGGTILITIVLMLLQYVLETTGKSDKQLLKVFAGKLEEDFSEAYENYLANASLAEQEQFYAPITIVQKENFSIEATTLVGRAWCNAHVIRVTNLGQNSVPQSIRNSPDTQFLVDQIQDGFAKMIAYGFYSIRETGDTIDIPSRASWFIEHYIEMVYTILHRAYACDMGGKHYLFAYAIQNYLNSKQADLQRRLPSPSTDDVENSEKAKNMLAFILTQYFVQAFLFLHCESELQTVYNSYVKPSSEILSSFCQLSNNAKIGTWIEKHHEILCEVGRRVLAQNSNEDDINPPYSRTDRWFHTVLSCYDSMR